MAQSAAAMLSPHTTAPLPRPPTPSEFALPDLTDDEWILVASLLSAGVTPARLFDLFRLRDSYHRPQNAAIDGFSADTRTLFARWLVQRGLLNEAM